LPTDFIEQNEPTAVDRNFTALAALTLSRDYVLVASNGRTAKPKPNNEIAYCKWFTGEAVGSVTASPMAKVIVQSVLALTRA